MKKILQVILALGLLMSFHPVGRNTASASEAKQVFRMGITNLPYTLDPAEATSDSDSSTVIKGLFEGLVRLNESGQAVPGIAKSWKISSDGKTYTFTLRSGAKWSNQQQVKASDFVYAWRRVLAPESENLYSFKMNMIAKAEDYNKGKLKDFSKVGIKALNNNTLQVTLKEKTAYFIQLLAENVYLPVNAVAAKADPYWAEDPKTLVTNGPFKLKEWHENAITLVKNPNYYAASEIHFTEVELIRPTAGESITTEYINGTVDWAGGKELLDYEKFSAATQKDLYVVPMGSVYYYIFNINEAPFDNVKIRKALAMAIDRESLRFGTPAYGFVPRNIAGAQRSFRSEVKDTAYFKEDVKLANQLLQEGLKEEGLPQLPSFTIIVNEGSEHEFIAESIVSGWNENLGIEADVEVQDWADLLYNRMDQNFTVARAGWSGDYSDPSAFLEYFTSSSANNDSGWSSPLYDSYLRQASQTLEPGARMKLYAKAEKLLIQDQMIIIPLYYYIADVLHKPYIHNVYVDYDGSIAFARGYIK